MEPEVERVMDAVKYLKTLQRMCRSSSDCMACPLFTILRRGCGLFSANSEGLVDTTEIVEKWAKDHPARTRQSVFLEQYPNAEVNPHTGARVGCPSSLNAGTSCENFVNDILDGCNSCQIRYWLQEVPE